MPKARITIGIIITFMFHSFFFILKQGPGTYLSFHILSVLFNFADFLYYYLSLSHHC